MQAMSKKQEQRSLLVCLWISLILMLGLPSDTFTYSLLDSNQFRDDNNYDDYFYSGSSADNNKCFELPRSGTHKPQMDTNKNILMVNEGEALEISCTGATDLNFYFPNFDDKDDINAKKMTSNYNLTKIKNDNGNITITFHRPFMSDNDEGWYGCGYQDNRKKCPDNPKEDKNATWIQVYIDSTLHDYDIGELWENKPVIEDFLQHIPLGSDLHIKCKAELETNQYLSWVNLKNLTCDEASKTSNSTNEYTSECTKKNVSEDDGGKYTCQVTLPITHEVFNTSVNIYVYDPADNYIDLKYHNDLNHFNVHSNSSVIFEARFYGHPEPKFYWLDNFDRTVVPNSKFKINRKKNYETISSLIIENVQAQDIDNYTIQVVNYHVKKNISFNLVVYGIPHILQKSSEENIQSWESSKTFHCEALGYPNARIEWILTTCSKFESDNCKQSKLKAKKEIVQGNSKIYSEVEIEVKMFGNLTCRACNSYGCDLLTRHILVDDNTLDILKPKNKIFVGDDIDIICASSNKYFSSLEWEFRNKDYGLSVNQLDDTNFFHRNILSFRNAQKSDERTYTCIRTNLNRKQVKLEYVLFIEEPLSPTLIDSNMNESQLLISESESRNNISFKCLVRGNPKPNITWYKNEEPLDLMKAQFVPDKTHQVLTIQNLLKSDSGNYSCVAVNRFGQIQKFQVINITEIEHFKLWMKILIGVAVTTTMLVICFCIRTGYKQMMRNKLLETRLRHFEEGALPLINPELTINEQAELLPYDRKWEFPREKLKIGNQLGNGAFGVVMKAEADGICPNESTTTIAVKMLRKDAEQAEVCALASELKIMAHLGKHVNILNLLGACTKNVSRGELFIVVEYCRFGNLQNYLLRNRLNFIDEFEQWLSNSLTQDVNIDEVRGRLESSNDRSPEPNFYQDFFCWAFQIARGMEYLSERKVLHGDLAARNILLAENNIVKICDFGLAKNINSKGNYQKKSDKPMPIKWMAIESIRDQVFSIKSDVWSFGIVLWEIFSLAVVPYPGMEVQMLYQKLLEGYRMEKPEYAPQNVYKIMLRCWDAEPNLRPSFTELNHCIGELLDESVKMAILRSNHTYENINKANELEGKIDYLALMASPDSVTPGSIHLNIDDSSPEIPNPTYLSVDNNNLLTDKNNDKFTTTVRYTKARRPSIEENATAVLDSDEQVVVGKEREDYTTILFQNDENRKRRIESETFINPSFLPDQSSSSESGE